MKNLLVIHTGGTISMSEDESNKVMTNDDNPITHHQDVIAQYANIDEQVPFNVPSPHMTIDNVKILKEIIEDPDHLTHFDGYVITHGTDTLEETAFLLDLTISTSKPVVITGAMRSSNEIGSDGLYNFISAIRVAIEEESAVKVSWWFSMMRYTQRVMSRKLILQTRIRFKVPTTVRLV